MRGLVCVLVIATGCSFTPGTLPGGTRQDGGDAPGRDGTLDPDGTPDARSCWGSGGVQVCFASPPTGAPVLPGLIDTDTSTLCSTQVVGGNAGAFCVIAGDAIAIAGAAYIRAIGSKPIVLVATTTITITGTLDARSHLDGNYRGAGAVPAGNTVLCDPGAAPGSNGGGAGGSFGSRGAGGGNSGGVSGVLAAATTLRGGCAGQAGASGTPGTFGLGGGAVYLIAGTQIAVPGTINASGGAGSAGLSGDGGGGGGGAGGMIGFDAPTVDLGGVIFANGGGGAEGAGNMTQGAAGLEPTGGSYAPGVDGGSNGGGGGNGASGTVTAGGGADAGSYGGGGGGGGVGVIEVLGTRTGSGLVSPGPT